MGAGLKTLAASTMKKTEYRECCSHRNVSILDSSRDGNFSPAWNTEHMSTKEYLKMIVRLKQGMSKPKGYYYSCIEEYVLAKGQPFEPRPLPEEYEYMPLKRCYENAALMTYQGLSYVEGYATTSIGFTTMHAWNLDDAGQVVDVTWRFKKNYHPMSYYGVVFDTGEMRKIILRVGHYGVLDNWKEKYPLLKNP